MVFNEMLWHSLDFAKHSHMFDCSQFVPQNVELRHHAHDHSYLRLVVSDVKATDLSITARWSNDSCKHIEESRLAGTVVSKQAKHFVSRNFKINTFDSMHVFLGVLDAKWTSNINLLQIVNSQPIADNVLVLVLNNLLLLHLSRVQHFASILQVSKVVFLNYSLLSTFLTNLRVLVLLGRTNADPVVLLQEEEGAVLGSSVRRVDMIEVEPQDDVND